MALRELTDAGEKDGERTPSRTKGSDGKTTSRQDRSHPVAELHRSAGNQAVQELHDGGYLGAGRGSTAASDRDRREDDGTPGPNEEGREQDATTGDGQENDATSGDDGQEQDATTGDDEQEQGVLRAGGDVREEEVRTGDDARDGSDRSGRADGDASDARTRAGNSAGLQDRTVAGDGFALKDDRNASRGHADESEADAAAETLEDAAATSALEQSRDGTGDAEWTWELGPESSENTTFSISEEVDVLEQGDPNLKQRAEQHAENLQDPEYHAKSMGSYAAGPVGPLVHMWEATDKAETRQSELGVSGSISPSFDGEVAEIFGQITASLDTGRKESETLRVADEDGAAWKVWNAPGGETNVQETGTDFGSSSLPHREKVLAVRARTGGVETVVNQEEASVSMDVSLQYTVEATKRESETTSVGGGVGGRGASAGASKEWSDGTSYEIGEGNGWTRQFRFVATKGDQG